MAWPVTGRAANRFGRAPPVLQLGPDGGVQVIQDNRPPQAGSPSSGWKAGFQRSVGRSKRAKSPEAYRQRATLKAPLPSEVTPRAKASSKQGKDRTGQAPVAARARVADDPDPSSRTKSKASQRRALLAMRSTKRAEWRTALLDQSPSSTAEQDSEQSNAIVLADSRSTKAGDVASVRKLLEDHQATVEAMQVSLGSKGACNGSVPPPPSPIPACHSGPGFLPCRPSQTTGRAVASAVMAALGAGTPDDRAAAMVVHTMELSPGDASEGTAVVAHVRPQLDGRPLPADPEERARVYKALAIADLAEGSASIVAAETAAERVEAAAHRMERDADAALRMLDASGDGPAAGDAARPDSPPLPPAQLALLLRDLPAPARTLVADVFVRPPLPANAIADAPPVTLPALPALPPAPHPSLRSDPSRPASRSVSPSPATRAGDPLRQIQDGPAPDAARPFSSLLALMGPDDTSHRGRSPPRDRPSERAPSSRSTSPRTAAWPASRRRFSGGSSVADRRSAGTLPSAPASPVLAFLRSPAPSLPRSLPLPTVERTPFPVVPTPADLAEDADSGSGASSPQPATELSEQGRPPSPGQQRAGGHDGRVTALDIPRGAGDDGFSSAGAGSLLPTPTHVAEVGGMTPSERRHAGPEAPAHGSASKQASAPPPPSQDAAAGTCQGVESATPGPSFSPLKATLRPVDQPEADSGEVEPAAGAGAPAPAPQSDSPEAGSRPGRRKPPVRPPPRVRAPPPTADAPPQDPTTMLSMDLEFDVDDLRGAVASDLWSHLSEQLRVTPVAIVCERQPIPNDDTPLASLGLTESAHMLVELRTADADALERSMSYEQA